MIRANSLLTVDAVIVVGNDVLLVRRGHDPFQGMWAIPGGFVEEGERLMAAAARELREETGVVAESLEEFRAYGEPGRDPRGRTVSFIFWQELKERPSAKAADDAADCGWFSLLQLPPMAFDHAQILADFQSKIRRKG